MPGDQALARKMLSAAPYRGPDLAVRVLGNCVLGIATRPDFVDESISSDGSMIAVLSGRIDNAADLYRELTAAGSVPASTADADVVVGAFRAFGTDAPNRMRGTFAAALTDGTGLWCFRDHVGFRPLFYHHGPRVFVAASDARSVVVGAQISEEPDLEVLERLFYGHLPANTPAALKGVARLPQATTLSVGADQASTPALHHYWHPNELLETSRLGPGDVRDRFVELMDQAATRALIGQDLILLSGGVDSPAVAAFAAPAQKRRTGRALGALSLVFPDLPKVDEQRYIELVARDMGLDLHMYRPAARALDDVERWCHLFGSPIPILSVPELADSYQRARSLGYEGILSGDYAEPLFGKADHLVSHLVSHGRLRALAQLLDTEHRRRVSRRDLAGLVLETFVPGRLANWYLRVRGRDKPGIPDWLDSHKVFARPYRADLLTPVRQRWGVGQRADHDVSSITLEAAELCSVLAGVKARRPLADIDLWEFFISLRAEVKFPDLRHKTLVRNLLRGFVPDAVLDRTDKTYFDDHTMSQVDYPALKRLLSPATFRMPGVNYERLLQKVEQAALTLSDWIWTKDLAQVHAFLKAW